MSSLQYPQGLTPSDVQIWNNAAFDHGGSEELGRSWSPKNPLLVKKIAESFGSVSTKEKENRSPLLENSICPKSPRRAVKPLYPNGALESAKFVSGVGNFKSGSVNNAEVGIRDEKMIDKEIEEIEKEISLLSSRLQALRTEKAEKSVKNVEKRGRVVTAKFLEPKQILKNADERKKTEERSKIQRRGLSLGPCEILSAVKSPLLGKQGMITPIQPIQSRRKSCFWKLQETDEENQRKTVGKPIPSRQAVTTLPSKKTVKKDEVFLQSVQPKKLFEKSAPAANKKCQRAGRIVPSRYNLSPSTQRKRSFPPENDKDESKICDKKRSLSLGKVLLEMVKNPGAEIRVKKRWEIPEEIVLHKGSEGPERSAEKTCVVMPDKSLLLPRINTNRCVKESPRDSGPAKRVAELAGRKSFFSNVNEEEDDDLEEGERVICQALQFADDD
ncbi:hypothetical protein DM860_009399 [Cuscuta australis]|uniref:Uncharacterized protein n=1 Tax=Cuscuta australis TaxID=267555 RepID=A0A328DAM5_9ASTE|nr:hypothetical protein DM860_009399 [Cuscuta australis]